MKGIVCEQVEQFKLLELEEPVFTEGEAIVRIKRVGICGTDLHAYKGNQPFFSYPRILGHELSGIIEQIGDNAEGFQAGDQISVIPYLHCGECVACRNGKTNCCTSIKVLGVHADGGMREKISVPVTHLLNTNGLTLEQAAVIEPFSIGAHAVRHSGLGKGDTALVIGAGPIGLGIMALAKHAGANVIAMDVNNERLAFCKQWAKVDHAVNALDNPTAQLEALTNGDYPIIVFDATGNTNSMSAAVQYVAHGGTLVYVGLVKGHISFDDSEFHKRELTIMGSRNATKEDCQHVLDVLRAGGIDVNSYVTHQVPFNEMIEHFDSWLDPANKVIKAMIEFP
ncbi:2-desacetyl-2-hydroxyethyl bacteriochlorophyllide A dehydrogenase [Paenibacillus catalpae]|uniref:2-desacetyl-2-hydroxyethyl bacteriochlorophyllide A dehydrogenase n=1 Tax=Paenibacillus catalpae TaxID=1045775 RepID=A0A1I1U7J6_9BACL|nr:zinc-binding alcohol dehydrogenase family protein [Paenibacillus catalpae]SFD65548.1 2-desacetyl-2-hydroxyethyl bacteriochlorophyllide A dehydrogenase [Paenibacillus catalpae]